MNTYLNIFPENWLSEERGATIEKLVISFENLMVVYNVIFKVALLGNI